MKKLRRVFLLVFLSLVCALISLWRFYEWRDHSQDAPILAASQRYGVEPALVKAVVWRESRFNPRARGSRGEYGLMQIMPDASAKDWAKAEKIKSLPADQLLNPATNTFVGAWYLSKLLKRYSQADDPLPYALADYNAGRENVLKWIKGAAQTNSAVFIAQIGFPGTKRYVQTVKRRYEHYRPIFPPAKE